MHRIKGGGEREMKKNFILVLITVLSLYFVSESSAQEKFKVAIVRSNSRVTYLEGQEGILAGFKKEGFDEAKLELEIRNYEDNEAKALEIIKDLKAKKVDVIITLGTDAAKQVFKEVKDIPIVFSQIVDPVSEGFAKSLESSGNNTTGTLTWLDMTIIVKVLREVCLAKRIGILYSENDTQSVAHKKQIEALQSSLGFTAVAANIKASEEAGDVVKSLVGRVDSVYISAGNTVAKGLDVILEVTNKFKIPNIAEASDKADKGALLAVTASRVKLGELAAKKAIEILNGKKPSDIPIEPLRSYDIIVNLKAAKGIEIDIPVSLLKITSKVIKNK